MAVLRFAGALSVVALLHAAVVEILPEAAAYVDLFLILTVAWAFESTTMVGLVVGLAAGLTADAFAGGLYGLNGFADTLVGYLTAFSVANLAKMNTSGVALLYALAAIVQQAVLILLVVLLIPNGVPPPLGSVIGKTLTTAMVGIVVYRGRLRFARTLVRWKQARESRLRF